MKRSMSSKIILLIATLVLLIASPLQTARAQSIFENPFSIFLSPVFQQTLEDLLLQLAGDGDVDEPEPLPRPRESFQLARANTPSSIVSAARFTVSARVNAARAGRSTLTDEQLALLEAKDRESLRERAGRVFFVALIDAILSLEFVAEPAFSPADQTVFANTLDVTLSTETPDAVIRFTIDGSAPTSSSTEFIGPIRLDKTTTVKARAFKAGLIASGTATATFILRDKVADPVFDPPDATTFENTLVVTITSETAGAAIRFTTDGSTPDSTSEEFTGPFTLEETTTVKARAFKTALTTSEVVEVTYTK